MNKAAIMNKANRIFAKSTLKLKKYSPEILVVAGIVGTVTSTVMACRATTKVSEILDTTKKDIDTIHECREKKIVNGHEYTPDDAKKDLTITYAHTGVKLAKLYAPSILLGATSITCILASNNILRKRNAALAAAYTAIEKSFKEYRGRVTERFGDEVEREIRYNIKAKEIEKTVTDAKGKEKTVTETVPTVENLDCSPYARFFDEGCKGWEKDPEYNLSFLKIQQQYANDRLKAQGYLFLNDVYDALGIPRSKQGQVVGWIYDSKNPIGDNYVDFGIYNIHKAANRDFVNGYEPVILLDFNVDGNILDLI